MPLTFPRNRLSTEQFVGFFRGNLARWPNRIYSEDTNDEYEPRQDSSSVSRNDKSRLTILSVYDFGLCILSLRRYSDTSQICGLKTWTLIISILASVFSFRLGLWPGERWVSRMRLSSNGMTKLYCRSRYPFLLVRAYGSKTFWPTCRCLNLRCIPTELNTGNPKNYHQGVRS